LKRKATSKYQSETECKKALGHKIRNFCDHMHSLNIPMGLRHDMKEEGENDGRWTRRTGAAQFPAIGCVCFFGATGIWRKQIFLHYRLFQAQAPDIRSSKGEWAGTWIN
jgi:hypothetical protein